MKIKSLRYLIIIALLLSIPSEVNAFNKVVIWGQKLHTHTNSYVFFALQKAFRHLGYTTYWFDDADDLRNFDFSDTLFFTEGQADGKIPLRIDCKYILHNCDHKKYKHLFDANRCICLQVYTHDVLGRSVENIDEGTYIDVNDKCIYMPWATDLLPHEIETIQQRLKTNPIKTKNIVYWVGTIGEGTFGNTKELSPFIKACEENKIIFKSLMQISMEKNQELIQESIVAPTIVGTWQNEKGYIPCRIFKNISYGQMGVTNSKTIYELFKGKIIYNEDTHQLLYDALSWQRNPNLEQLLELMDLVKTKHTYLNRIQNMLYFLTTVTGN